MKVLLASRNRGKAREIEAIVAPHGVHVAAAPGEWDAPAETGTTYLENALLKARSLAELTGEPVIADDSGIEVDLLAGEPGVQSAYFAGPAATDQENLGKMIDAIQHTPPALRAARYRCVAVYVAGAGADPVVAEGVVEGTLIDVPRGTGGFGYDPIFVPQEQTRTMSELSPAEKDAISHRGKAFRALAEAITAL